MERLLVLMMMLRTTGWMKMIRPLPKQLEGEGEEEEQDLLLGEEGEEGAGEVS
jgi:hypothetical protein